MTQSNRFGHDGLSPGWKQLARDRCLPDDPWGRAGVGGVNMRIREGFIAFTTILVAAAPPAPAIAQTQQQIDAIAEYDQAVRLDPVENLKTLAAHTEQKSWTAEIKAELAQYKISAPQDKPKAANELAPKSWTMAAEVLARLEAIKDYRELSALYDRRVAADLNWLQSAEGRAVDAQLKDWRRDAAATAIVDDKEGRILRYSVGGVIVRDSGVAAADLEKSPAYRRTIAEAIAQNIMTSPLDPKVQAALAAFRNEPGASSAAASAAGSAQAAGSDKFCAQIQAIVADAPNSFAAFRGQRTRQETSQVPPPTTVNHYAASGTPEGATACEITANDTATSGLYYPNYSCEFPVAGTNKGAETQKLARRVAACLPGISRPMGPGLSKDSGMLSAHSSDYSLSYFFLSGPAKQTIHFSIQNGRK